MCLEVERESPRRDKSVMSRMWQKVYWASKFPPWTGWMTPVNLPAFEDCDGLHGFQSWAMGGWPNLASEKLKALRVIDKLVIPGTHGIPLDLGSGIKLWSLGQLLLAHSEKPCKTSQNRLKPYLTAPTYSQTLSGYTYQTSTL